MESEKKQASGKDIVNAFVDSVEDGKEHLIDVARKITEDKENVTFSLSKRKLQDEQPKPPVRKESPRRAHVFHSAKSFIAYLLKYKTENTVVLADVQNNTIEAVIDNKAKNGFETICFIPQIHPLFKPWNNQIINSEKEIREFAVFLQQNKKTILTPDAKELTMFFSQIRASQEITMHKGIGQGSVNGLTCKLTIMSKTENQEVELPESMTIEVPIYIDTPKQEIEIDILLTANNTDTFALCSSSMLDVHKVTAFENMIEEIKAVDGIVVGFGGVDYQEWKYLGGANY